MKTNLRANRGFSVIDVIIAVSVIGVLSAIAYKSMPLILNLTRERAIAANVNELNGAVQSLVHSGATFTNAAYAFTNGSSTATAAISIPTGAGGAGMDSFVAQLRGAGITSLGHLTKLNDSSTITSASYSIAYTANPAYPVFSRNGTALTP